MLSIEEALNWNGRFSRLEYVIYGNLIPLIFLLLLEYEYITGFLVLLICIVLIILNINSTIKRMHDLNMSAWSLFLLIIPLVNITLYIYLLFFKGDPNENQYGKPLK